MKGRLLFLVLLCIAAGIASGRLSADTKQTTAFSQLRDLAGDWEGTVAWTGQQSSEISAHYYTTGNGSAVVEDLSNGMTSVYHFEDRTSE